MTGREDDLEDLRASLIARTEDLALALLGQPQSRAGHQWRWGGKGAVALDVRGPKRGLWIDRRDGAGGDLLELIRRERGGGFPATLDFARSFLRMPAVERPTRQPAKPDTSDANRIAWAQRLAGAGVPIDGTIAETYLVETRRIPKPAGGWPAAVRFHRDRRALMLTATDAAGAVRAVHLVYLTAEGHKLSAEEALRRKVPERAKQTFGGLAGAAVRLPGAAGPVLVAEGPETGLSVWAATGRETWISLGTSNMPKLSPPAGRAVVVCRDDDLQWSPADRALRKAVHAWREAGAEVHIASPWPARRQDKTDFNDALQANGADAVAARIEAALRPARGTSRRDQATARKLLAEAVSKFEAAAVAFDPASNAAPPTHALRVDLGVGKSRAARDMLARQLVAMRLAGDKRTVVVAIPTHRLGEDQAAAFEALPIARKAGLTAAVWRSREAVDPSAPDQRMCTNLEAVRDARAAGADVQRAACQREMPDGTVISCPFFGGCAFQAQRHRTADLWLVAHEMLFTAKPAAIGKPAMLVVDEAPWHAAVRLDPKGRPLVLSLDALGAKDRRPGDLHQPNWEVLQHHRSRAANALRDLPDGPLTAEAMDAFGLTADDAGEAITLEWSRKVAVEMHPGMTAAARKAAVLAAESNKTVARLAMFWTAVRELLRAGGAQESGWAALATEATEHGPVRVLELKGRKPVREGWQVPTLLMDATLNLDLVRPIWPQAEITAEVAVGAPHQTIRQVGDVSFSKRRLAPAPETDEAELSEAAKADKRRRSRNLRELHAIIGDFTRRFAPGRVLGVVQKAIEEALPAVGPLPTSLELAHHNAVAGRDEWGPGDDRPGIAGLVVVGRTSPPPADVERLAECLTGRAVAPLAGWYPRVAVGREMADGSTVAAEADRHPDPVAEAIRWRICEGELLQIIGRARGVNRTKADPVEILVMTDVPLPLPIDAVLAAADLAPGPVELMLAAGGAALDCAADAARAFPTLWPARDGSGGSPEAARKAFGRRGAGQTRIKTLLYGNVPHLGLRLAAYQLAGPGRNMETLAFDPALVPDPRAWLEERVGPLAAFELIPPAVAPAEEPAMPPAKLPPEQARLSPATFGMRPPPIPGGEDGMWISTDLFSFCPAKGRPKLLAGDLRGDFYLMPSSGPVWTSDDEHMARARAA